MIVIDDLAKKVRDNRLLLDEVLVVVNHLRAACEDYSLLKDKLAEREAYIKALEHTLDQTRRELDKQRGK